MPADSLDLDALGRREALTMDGRSLFHPPCVVLTVAERDALVALARKGLAWEASPCRLFEPMTYSVDVCRHCLGVKAAHR
jgi:hypothetical protein